MSDETTLNVAGLDKLLKALKANKPPVARVGILGTSKNSREKNNSKSSENLTNADVGAIHEFGSIKRSIPARSFLRVPITDNLQKYMEKAGALDTDTLAAVIKSGSITSWVKKIAILGEAIVSDAFETGGFGKWPAWKNPNYSNEANQLLVDTQQLRNSITSEVKE